MKAPELQELIGTLLETEHDKRSRAKQPGTEPSREILAGDVLSLRVEL
jgi:hypothetical protein